MTKEKKLIKIAMITFLIVLVYSLVYSVKGVSFFPFLALTTLEASPVDSPIREPKPDIKLLYRVWGFDGPPKLDQGWAELWTYDEYGAVDDDFLYVMRNLGDYSNYKSTGVIPETWAGIMNLHTADWEINQIGSGATSRIYEIWNDMGYPGTWEWGSTYDIFTPTYAGKAYAMMPSNVLGKGRQHGIQDLFYTISSPPMYWLTFVHDVSFIDRIKGTLNGENTWILEFQGVNEVDFGQLYITDSIFGFPLGSWRYFKTTTLYDLKTGVMLASVIEYASSLPSPSNPDYYSFRIEVRTLEEVNDVAVSLPSFLSIDSDGDGLVDKIEEIIGTNPEINDTDGDGFSDGDEIRIIISDPRVFGDN